MIFDTHCHLYDQQLYGEIDTIIEKANDSGVCNMLVLGDKIETSLLSLDIANKYNNIYCAVGIHPCECHGLDLEVTLNKLYDLAKNNPKVKAIGEIGLDYYWEKDEKLKDEQKLFFVEQLKLADRLGLPVSIHSRDSIEDVYNLLKENFPKGGAILHCFSSSVEMMRKFVKLGCYISLGGPVTFKNAITPKEVAKETPIEKLLIETDSPYLAPHPNRGKRNEPSFLPLVLAEIARIKNVTTLKLEKIVFNNSCKILGV